MARKKPTKVKDSTPGSPAKAPGTPVKTPVKKTPVKPPVKTLQHLLNDLR